MFENRKLIIATNHEKEKIIAPLFEEAFEVKYFASDSVRIQLGLRPAYLCKAY